jgi:hypothetical protein
MPRQVLARRQEPPTDLRETGRITRLPTELLSEQAARLTVFTTVAAVLWSVALLMDVILLPVLSDTWVRNWRIIPIEIVGVLGSALMRGYLRRADLSAEHKSTVGVGMMLMNAALIAVINAWAMPAIPPGAPEIGRPSWIALLILIFAMIAPGVSSLLLSTRWPSSSSGWSRAPRRRWCSWSSSAGRVMPAPSSSWSRQRCSSA